jgi:MFS transporter, DHA2 family, multidrug resistance protein
VVPLPRARFGSGSYHYCPVFLAVRAKRTGFSIIRLDIFKDAYFAAAAFYNFMTSGLLFVAVLFLPVLAQGPLGYSATLSGFTIVPRAVLMTLTMLLVGPLIGRVSYRLLLGTGWLLMAAGLAILSDIEPTQALLWMLAGSIIQAIGAGLLFTPHSTLAFSTLAPDQRTDAAGVYSLVRQLGFASGVALMTAVLRTRVDAHLLALPAPAGGAGAAEQLVAAATLGAYADCFSMMALAAIAVSPGVLLFRSTPPVEALAIETDG